MAYDYADYDTDEKEKPVVTAPPEGGEAKASGKISMNEAAFQAFINEKAEIWTTARHAGTLAVTGTDRILIVGHSVNIASAAFSYETNDDDNSVIVTCHVKTRERMRAESPALLGCGCALISIIDRLRLMDRSIKIESLGLMARD